MSRILVVDDERSVRAAFAEILAGVGHEVVTAGSAAEAFERLQSGPIDLVVLDVCMPGMDGLQALERIKEHDRRLPVIIMTGHGTMETAIEATRRGAYDYQLKPLDPARTLETIDKALHTGRLAREPVVINPESATTAGDAMIGGSPAMQEVYKAIGRVAPTDATVLIRGESGTGKELAARAVYQYSRRADAPFLVVNCVATPETLLEDELFGHEAGAFTGAQGGRAGKFEQVHGGTMFLDEIGDISLGIQAKLLRVLQERSFQRIGGNETLQVDVRVLAATNRDLEKSITEGAFREDLYHRLNVVSIRLPPLRDRSEDIPSLVDHFLDRFSRELGIPRPAITADALRLLQGYAWPGNVRELQHAVQRALIFTGGFPIEASHLSFSPVGGGDAAPRAAKPDAGIEDLARCHLDTCGGQRALESFLAKAEAALIGEALRRTGGNQTRAARLLGIPRPTLHARMRRLGFS